MGWSLNKESGGVYLKRGTTWLGGKRYLEERIRGAMLLQRDLIDRY